jgi:hypothetical protein
MKAVGIDLSSKHIKALLVKRERDVKPTCSSIANFRYIFKIITTKKKTQEGRGKNEDD